MNIGKAAQAKYEGRLRQAKNNGSTASNIANQHHDLLRYDCRLYSSVVTAFAKCRVAIGTPHSRDRLRRICFPHLSIPFNLQTAFEIQKEEKCRDCHHQQYDLAA